VTLVETERDGAIAVVLLNRPAQTVTVPGTVTKGALPPETKGFRRPGVTLLSLCLAP
jgi:hypothetical protein